MTGLSANNLMQNFAKNHDFSSMITKSPVGSILDRHHFSSPSGGGGGYHHHHGGGSIGSGKHSIALSALTLLSFLFFLHILQSCLDENMQTDMTQQIIIMQGRLNAAREAEKRKGDMQLSDNATLQGFQEAKAAKVQITNTKIVRTATQAPTPPPTTSSNKHTKYYSNQFMQVPIKLKSSEKYKYN